MAVQGVDRLEIRLQSNMSLVIPVGHPEEARIRPGLGAEQGLLEVAQQLTTALGKRAVARPGSGELDMYEARVLTGVQTLVHQGYPDIATTLLRSIPNPHRIPE